MAQKRPEDSISADEPSLPIREVREGSPTKKLKSEEPPFVDAQQEFEDEDTPESAFPDDDLSLTEDLSLKTDPKACRWVPPVYGSPTWLEIPTTDIAAAKTFYSTVFNWTFRTHPAHDASLIQMFSVPDPRLQTSLGGGLVKVDKKTADYECVGPTVVVYLIVDDIDEAFEKIKAAGGEVLAPGKISEGNCGWMGKFKDLDGNIFGVYGIMKEVDNVFKEDVAKRGKENMEVEAVEEQVNLIEEEKEGLEEVGEKE
ncbi:hypothetical protein RUND412_009693 [Rhizina undulata]